MNEKEKETQEKQNELKKIIDEKEKESQEKQNKLEKIINEKEKESQKVCFLHISLLSVSIHFSHL